MRLVETHETNDYDIARQMIVDNLDNNDRIFLMDYYVKRDYRSQTTKTIYRVLEYAMCSNNSLDILLNTIEKLEKARDTRYFNIFLKHNNIITLIEREL